LLEGLGSLGGVPRVARSVLPDGVFHITARGVARSVIFRDELDYSAFEMQLHRVQETFGWNVHTYCLMPNHYHLIVGASRLALSNGMHRLNGRYARRFNDRYDRSGHLFQNRYTAYVIDDEEHYERALAYVRDNPVKAGLCERAEEWPWAHVPGTVPETCP
jgi:REP-associated tyrosine transposase